MLQAPAHWQWKHNNYPPLEALTRWQRKHNNCQPQHCSCRLHVDHSCSCLHQHHLSNEVAVQHGTSKNRAAPALAKGIVARWEQLSSFHRVLGPWILVHAAAVDSVAMALDAGPAAAAVAAPKNSWPWLPCFLQRPVVVVVPAVMAARVPVIVALVHAGLVRMAARVPGVALVQAWGKLGCHKVLSEKRPSSRLEKSHDCLLAVPAVIGNQAAGSEAQLWYPSLALLWGVAVPAEPLPVVLLLPLLPLMAALNAQQDCRVTEDWPPLCHLAKVPAWMPAQPLLPKTVETVLGWFPVSVFVVPAAVQKVLALALDRLVLLSARVLLPMAKLEGPLLERRPLEE